MSSNWRVHTLQWRPGAAKKKKKDVLNIEGAAQDEGKPVPAFKHRTDEHTQQRGKGSWESQWRRKDSLSPATRGCSREGKKAETQRLRNTSSPRQNSGKRGGGMKPGTVKQESNQWHQDRCCLGCERGTRALWHPAPPPGLQPQVPSRAPVP